jgi:hypothetical protein
MFVWYPSKENSDVFVLNHYLPQGEQAPREKNVKFSHPTDFEDST